MTTIPLSIAKYIRALWMSELILTYLHVDRDGRLAGWGGHPRHYGLPNLLTGEWATDQVLFLEGLLPVAHTEVLEFVQVGRGRAAHIHLVPFQGGTWVLLFDATAEHDRQQRLQQQLNELSLLNYRQGRLLQELENARRALLEEKQRVEQASETKSRFIANLSHELRTPLSSIVGYTHLLERLTQADRQENEYLDSVRGNANHLLSLIDSILDETRLESGQVLLQAGHCEMKPLLADVRGLFFPLAGEKGLALEIQATPGLPDILILDEMRLRQVLINLLNNALKFTRQGFIHLRLDWRESRLEFAVADSGPGIAADSLPKLFTPYHREKIAHSLPGAGLGLTITRQLVELMGGKIEVQSALGQGTVFSGFISAPSAQPAAESRADARASGCTVLIAEDTTLLRMLMETYLQEGGYTVFSAADGAEVLDLVPKVQPDVILMDMQMPVMDGYTAVQHLRRQHFDRPILALSASNMPEDRKAALRAGCDDYLLKPVSLEVLLETTARVTSRARLNKETIRPK